MTKILVVSAALTILILIILIPSPNIRKRLAQLFSKRKTQIAKISLVIAPLGLIATSASLVVAIQQGYFSEAEVQAEITKYNKGNITSYGGKLNNTSSVHADNLHMKSNDFDPAKIIDFQVDTKDQLEFKDFHKGRCAEFCLKRLTKKSHCNFDLIIKSQNKVSKDIFQISWGKSGKVEVTATELDSDSIAKIERGIRMSDLSHDSRRRWIDSNTKNIK